MNFLKKQNPSTHEALASVAGRSFSVSSGSRALGISKGEGGFIRSAEMLGSDYGYETKVVLALRTGNKVLYALHRREFDIDGEISLRTSKGKISILLLPVGRLPPGFARSKM